MRVVTAVDVQPTEQKDDSMPMALADRMSDCKGLWEGVCEWCGASLSDNEGVRFTVPDALGPDKHKRVCNIAHADAFEKHRLSRYPQARAIAAEVTQ